MEIAQINIGRNGIFGGGYTAPGPLDAPGGLVRFPVGSRSEPPRQARGTLKARETRPESPVPTDSLPPAHDAAEYAQSRAEPKNPTRPPQWLSSSVLARPY